jgi:hypothetical protein
VVVEAAGGPALSDAVPQIMLKRLNARGLHIRVHVKVHVRVEVEEGRSVMAQALVRESHDPSQPGKEAIDYTIHENPLLPSKPPQPAHQPAAA